MHVREQSPQGTGDAGASELAAAPVGKYTGVQRQAAGASPGAGPEVPNVPGAPEVQRRGDGAGDDAAVHAAAQHGTRGASEPLPHLDTIQRLFGRHDVTGVKAHTGDDAATGARAMGAQAFATGDHVAFAGAPSLHTAAHEAAHVVQQRGGVQLKGGVGQVGDRYEQHADHVADLVVRGESAEPVLDQLAGGGGGAATAVQRAPVATSFGTFSDEIYAPIEQQGKKVGVEMALAFAPGTAADPGDKVEATKIGLVQSVKSVEGGATTLMNPGDAGKSVTGGAADGRQIDRLYGNNNPVYGADRLPDGKGLDATPESNAPQGEAAVVGGAKQNASYVLGHRTKDGAGWKAAPAKLSDKPKLPPGAPSSSQVFETTALALEGKDKDKYYGSVSWGWKTEADGKFTQLPLTKVSDGKPSEGFTEPAKQWNQYQVAAKINPPDGSGNTTTKTDLEVETSSRSFTIAAGSKLTVDLTGKSISGTMLVTLADPVQVVDGGMQWWSWIATAKVKDGAVTEDLNLKAHDAPYTLAKGSKVVEVGSSEIGGERLYKLGAAIVRGAAIGPRIVWVRDAELKGDKTVALPIPT